MVFTRVAGYLFIAALCTANVSGVVAQQPAGPASVEELTAMLQRIDPYRPQTEARGKIEIFGSTSMDAMAHGWVSGFTRFHPHAEVVISAAGPEDAFTRLLANPAGIVMLSRPVKPEELEELKHQGLKDPVGLVVAREALGVFVHASNPVKSISGEQLRSVFTAQANQGPLTWGMLGATGSWAQQPIRIVSRTENSGTQMFLQDFVFQSSELRKGVSEHISNAEVVGEIGQDPQAIAICGLRCGGTSAKPLQLMAGANVVPSDDHAVLAGHYPLTRPLTLVIDAGQTTPAAQAGQEFVRYALCQAGQTQAILAGFFPVDLPLLRAGMERLGARQIR